jgi:hypothetical protein
MSVPASHPLHLGYDIAPILQQADAVLFLESDVPWVPAKTQPSTTAFIAHAGIDPLFARYPMRSFRSDLSITASVQSLLSALIAALEQSRDAEKSTGGAGASRRARLYAAAKETRSRAKSIAAEDEIRGGPISKIFLSRCLDRVRPPKQSSSMNIPHAAISCSSRCPVRTLAFHRRPDSVGVFPQRLAQNRRHLIARSLQCWVTALICLRTQHPVIMPPQCMDSQS